MEMQNKILKNTACFFIAVGLFSSSAFADTLYVGQDKKYKVPSAAIADARNGDTIIITAGLYKSDYAIIRQNNLTLKSVGGYAHIRARKKIPNRKAIWVTQGDNIIVDGIKFTDAWVRDNNGAGIRSEGQKLTIRNSLFENNQMNIVTANMTDQALYIADSIFANPSKHKSLSHNIYVGSIKFFSLTNSKIYGAHRGQNVKSRASVTKIINNEIYDTDAQAASYEIDLANGGLALVEGNVITQSNLAENNHMIAYGSEGIGYEENELIMRNNKIINTRKNGIFLLNRTYVKPVLENNKFEGIALKMSTNFGNYYWNRAVDKIVFAEK